MNTEDDKRLYALWRSIFIRKGSNGDDLRIFNGHSKKIQDHLLSLLSMSEYEIPVLAYFSSESCWVVLTTEKITWIDENHIRQLKNKHIISVKPKDFGKVKKNEMHEFYLIDDQGGRYLIKVENGAPFFGFWNVLINLTLRSRRALGIE